MSIKPSYHGFNVWFEGNVSVRKRDKQTCLFCQNYNVDFVFCSLRVFCLFLLKLFALHNRLRKGWFLSSWFVSFFFQPRSTLALVCSCCLCKDLPASATSTSLSAKTDITVSVPFVVPNHGKKLQRRKLSHVQSFRVAHFRHVT